MESWQILPNEWMTQRLRIADIRPEDIEAVQAVYDRCRYVLEMEGKLDEYNPRYAAGLLENPELPPDGESERFRAQCVKTTENREIIGLLEVYHGYPEENVFWIGSLLIHPMRQKKGYGHELVGALINEVMLLDQYEYIQAGVFMRNWPAIRFWVRTGFDRIVRIKGDPEFEEGASATLVLEYQLQ